MLLERLKTHLEKAEGIKNVENYDFKPKEVPKNEEETQTQKLRVIMFSGDLNHITPCLFDFLPSYLDLVRGLISS